MNAQRRSQSYRHIRTLLTNKHAVVIDHGGALRIA